MFGTEANCLCCSVFSIFPLKAVQTKGVERTYNVEVIGSKTLIEHPQITLRL